MAEDDDESFTFGDFKFAPSPQPHLINNNGVSPTSQKIPIYQTKPDPGPVLLRKPINGALPLSFFGEVEDEDEGEKDDHLNSNLNNFVNGSKSNGWVDPKTGARDGKLGGNDQQIVSETGSGLHDGDDDDDDDDEWEFTGAFSGNGHVNHGNLQDPGSDSVISGAEKMEVMPLENKAGQDASRTIEQKPGFSSFSLQSNDLFAVFPSAVNISNGNTGGFKPTTVMTNGFMWDAFSGDENSSGSGIIAASSNIIEHKSSLSSSLPQARDLFVDSLGVGNGSRVIDVETKPTNGFAWDAFSGVEKIINGSDFHDTIGHKLRSSSFLPSSDNLFVAPLEAVNKSVKTDVGFKSGTETSDSFRFDAFPGAEKIGNGSAVSAASPNSVDQKPDSSSFLSPMEDLFAVPEGAFNRSSETIGGSKPTSVTANGFMFDAFPEVEEIRNGNGVCVATVATANEDDGFNDFGDFIDASQEVRTGDQLEQIVPHIPVAETHLDNGKSQDKQTQLTNGREALPLSFFGASAEETSETFPSSDEVVHKPTFSTANGVSGHGSAVSIHDLISNLYSQVQSAPSVGSDGHPVGNELQNSHEKEVLSLGGDDEWEDSSWEFKGAVPDAGVKEQPSSSRPWNVAQTQLETFQNVQSYIDFYAKLRDSLCFLLSCQLDELQKARRPDTGTGSPEITEMLDNEIQEAHKLLKQDVISQVVPQKHLERGSCLNEVFEILQDPKFDIIESVYPLSKRLQLADNDWRVAADLLKHAISILKSPLIGSADELFRYASTWYEIIDVCAQELSYGALIWKKVSEKEVQRQVLSDCRGQKYIQALGEIYKIVELLRLSAKVYKAWMLFSVSDSSSFMGILNECRALWLSSGLEEALQSLSDDVDFGCDETAEALLASINNIRDFDVLSMEDNVFGEHKSICRLSLLPRDKLPDLKTASWNGELYFLSLANLWANLVSCEPPQLPQVQFSRTDG